MSSSVSVCRCAPAAAAVAQRTNESSGRRTERGTIRAHIMTKLTFMGAARTVTGSKYLLDAGGRKILIDCGLFQGLKELRLRNWQPLAIDPADISAAILTHAHLDHTGYLPRLVADGYHGRVHCTAGTAELCKLVLPDSARLQEEEARQANRMHYSRHDPALPLYRESDAFRALSQLQPMTFNKPFTLVDGVDAEFIHAGHLLGSAFIRMTVKGGPTILFGGDLGRYSRPVLPDPSAPPDADVLLLESTYGDRVHEPDDQGARLAAIIKDTVARGGKLIIPSFAIGRVEEVLYWIKKLEDEGTIPKLPVFLDSPMALEALRYYANRANELDEDVRSGAEMRRFFTARFQAVSSAQQSSELVKSKIPSIVVSSSGMATGGRVLYHLRAALPDTRSTVLFVGYQAAGTRGRQLVDGVREVKIHGQFVPVNARVERIDSMSAHADSQETLRWLGGFKTPPRMTFLVHGEPVPMDALKTTIESQLKWKVHTPAHLEQVELS
jgi:metallo-beta-lactamase family protein